MRFPGVDGGMMAVLTMSDALLGHAFLIELTPVDVQNIGLDIDVLLRASESDVAVWWAKLKDADCGGAWCS